MISFDEMHLLGMHFFFVSAQKLFSYDVQCATSFKPFNLLGIVGMI
jgi:hypothetical protein